MCFAICHVIWYFMYVDGKKDRTQYGALGDATLNVNFVRQSSMQLNPLSATTQVSIEQRNGIRPDSDMSQYSQHGSMVDGVKSPGEIKQYQNCNLTSISS